MKKCILLTGASSGLGKEAALALSKNYNILINGRNEKSLSDIKSASENECYIWSYDLTNLDSLEKSLKRFLLENNLEVCGYVHCAGSMKMIPCKMINKDLLESIFAINVFSAALISKILTTKKINGQALKSIVYISSNISERGAKAFSIYGASKASLNGFMRCLAVELAPKTRVNTISPGAMKTRMTEEIFEDKEREESMEINYPLGIGKPEQIIPLIDFLISERASWITGQEFVVDGGRTINITE